tara:strand:- start:497 stop:1468 length:972 start_codon:yes stop_codon:yes gene_type:complete
MLKSFNPIIVVAGEPKSVFLELYIKNFDKFRKSPLVLIASHKLIIDQMNLLKLKKNINIININKKSIFQNLDNRRINLIDVDLKYRSLDKIKVKNANNYIKNCFDAAIFLLNKNKKLNLINGPIIKKDFLKKKYLGITEYLGSKYKRLNNVVMLIYNKNLSVSPITTHVPLKKVSSLITKKKIINHIRLIHQFYKKKLNKKPAFALTGLNPHCESNFGINEENQIIKPAIKFLSKKKYNISGPYPADTIFLKKNLKKFDVIIGMYHDQVLTPIKTLYEFDAINITLGLPFIRISPDHGPNLSMFGKNKSNSKSFIRSIEFLSK